MRTQTMSRRFCTSSHSVREMAETSPAAAVADLAPYAGTPRHVWQSLFLLVSTIRPDWGIDEIAHEVFEFRRAMPFPELSAAAIRAVQNPYLKTTVELRLAVLGTASDWLEGIDK